MRCIPLAYALAGISIYPTEGLFRCVCVCVCVCVCLCVCVCVHACMRACVLVSVYKDIYIYIYIYMMFPFTPMNVPLRMCAIKFPFIPPRDCSGMKMFPFTPMSTYTYNIIPHKTTQDKTRQNQTRQDKTRQNQTRQDKTRQDKTRQDKTIKDKTRQDKTRQDKTRQDKTIKDETIHTHRDSDVDSSRTYLARAHYLAAPFEGIYTITYIHTHTHTHIYRVAGTQTWTRYAHIWRVRTISRRLLSTYLSCG